MGTQTIRGWRINGAKRAVLLWETGSDCRYRVVYDPVGGFRPGAQISAYEIGTPTRRKPLEGVVLYDTHKEQYCIIRHYEIEPLEVSKMESETMIGGEA